MNTLIDVAHTKGRYIGRLGTSVHGSLPEIIQFFFIHAYTVIRHTENNIIPFQATGHRNRSFPPLAADPVNQGILN